MLGNFFPPVIFQVEAVAGKAIADFKAINTQLKVMEAQATKTGVALTRMNKAALVGTKVLKGMAVAFAGFAAIGVKEVIELERAFVRLGQTMANVGVSTEANRQAVAKLVDSYEELGFGSEKAADAYSVLLTATGDLEKSNRLLAVSADLARYRQMSLDEAARVMARATQGSARAFKELGITIDNTKPKAVAIEEAIDKLSQRVGGQAVAYSKTFSGQLAILNENLGDLAEQIGMRVLPFLNKLISGLNNSGEWIKKNQDFVMALTAAIVVALIPAVVNLTKKLAALALMILRSPIARLAAVVLAVSYGFVKAYNSSQKFREGVATVIKGVLALFGTLVNALENVVQGIMFIEKGSILAALGLAKLTRNKDAQRNAEEQLKLWEKNYAAIDKWSDGIESAKRKVEAFSAKKLEFKFDFKMPSIPGFENGEGFDGVGDALDKGIKKGLDRAQQRFADFARDVANEFAKIGESFARIVTKDIDTLIYQRIGDPVDKLIYDAQAAVNRYEAASSQWTAANNELTKSQNAYIEALKSGDDALIASAESALGYAEGIVTDLSGTMLANLEEIEQLQEQMIDSIVSMYEQISDLEADRTKILKEAQKERLELEKDYNQEVARLRKDYDASVIAAEAEAAKRRAEIIKTSVDQLRSAFRSATYRTLGSVYESLTFEGRYLKGGSMEKILSTLGLQTAKATKLADNAAKLAGLGFSQTFIEEVISLGPDMGNSLSQTILNSTPESIKQLQDYWKKLESTSLHGIDGVANALNSGMTLATEELTAQLAQVDIDLKNQLAEAQKALTDSLTEAFNNYSEALDEINNRTTEQIGAIDAQIAELNAKIAMMRSALSQLSTLTAPGASGSTTIIPRHETTEEEGPASSCESGKGIYKIVSYQGKVMSRTLVRCVPKTATTEPKPDTTTAPSGITFKTAAEAYTGITGATTLSGINAAVNAAVATNLNASSIANAMATALLKSPEISSIGGVAGALSSARYTGQAIAQMDRGVTVNITANTNASSQDIANDVGWAIRTSGDVQYRTASGYSTGMRAE